MERVNPKIWLNEWIRKVTDFLFKFQIKMLLFFTNDFGSHTCCSKLNGNTIDVIFPQFPQEEN